MSTNELSLIAHLMRRAGVGATQDELEEYAAKGYEAVVEDLLHPERFPEVEEDIVHRYYPRQNQFQKHHVWNGAWIYRMVNTQRPLQEKMALLWHQLFPTGVQKGSGPSIRRQIEMFRSGGLSDLRTILTELSKDPAMIYWLDNSENLKGEPNENYGRELLELFSMGVGNYTEEDIKMASRAFTGWTFIQPIPVYPHGSYGTEFEYREEDHDDGVKTFLGETGRFNGEDIIEIIVKQPATARFISRHLYNFFVADEPPVNSWGKTPPVDPEAIDTLVQAYFDSDGDMRSILRAMFNSEFFKEAQFKRVKSPTELVAGTLKMVGMSEVPPTHLADLHHTLKLMGQELQNPPTVEGWQTGKGWIDSGTLNERVNFAVDEVADATKPGVQAIINRLGADGASLSPEKFVDRCLELAGPVSVGDETRDSLLEYATSGGTLDLGTEAERQESVSRIVRMLQLIVSSREYQFA